MTICINVLAQILRSISPANKSEYVMLRFPQRPTMCGLSLCVCVRACSPAEDEFYDSFDVAEDPDFEHVDPPTEQLAATANETPVVRSADSHVTGSDVTVSIQETLSRIQGNLQLVLQRLNGLEDAVKSQQRQRRDVRGGGCFEWIGMCCVGVGVIVVKCHSLVPPPRRRVETVPVLFHS